MRKVINYITTFLLVFIFLASLFLILYKLVDYKKASNLNDEINKIVVNENSQISKFNSLKNINSDYVGWIEIENTNISYPILQSNDNEFYLDKDIYKEKLLSGSIFLDYRNNLFDDKNTIIYGHYMRNNTMFGELKKFKNRDFFNQNNKVSIYLEDKVLEYEVFSAYTTDTKFNYIETSFNNNDYINFLNSIKSKSKYHKEIDLKQDSKILTLSTCSYDFKDARTVVHAKLIREY